MENMTIASITVSTMLNTRLSISLKLLPGARQFVPEQSVAKESQAGGITVVAMSTDIVHGGTGEEGDNQGLQNL